MALVRARELFEEAPWFRGCAGAGAVCVTGLVTWRAVSGSLRHKAIEKRRKNYREQKLLEKRAYAQRFNASKDDVDKICSLSLPGLQEQLQSGALTASQVHEAYVKKAYYVDQEINCVTDYITEAQGKAKELDKATTKKPLHGLPYSIKELHAYKLCTFKGYPSTAGVQTLIPFPVEETFALTKILEDQGAVPFVRSNVPYTCMSYTCTNPLYGTTTNPHDTSRQPGGSSGGEGALVAAGATAISIGGDLGGSIRVPAAWCGVVGLKCGSTRLNNYLSTRGIPLESLKPVLDIAYGPLARDVESAALIMRHLLIEDMFRNNPYTPPVPFREEIYQDKKPLRVGFYSHDNVSTAVPSFVRAVDLVKNKLQDQGHTLVPFGIPVDDGKGNRWIDMAMKTFLADGGKMMHMFVDGDDPGDLFKFPRIIFPSMPWWFNLLLTKIYQLFDKQTGQILEYGCGTGSVFGWWKLVDAVLSWRRLVVKKMKQENIDVLLSPAFSCPALLKKYFLGGSDFSSYAVVYNLLDWPAGVVPVTKVTSEDIQQMDQYPSNSTTANIIIESMQGAEGLPVAVQIAAPPYGEELCLRAMKEIEDAVNFG